VLLGGRMAEEVVFERVTTGAADDLRRVTEISRSMVEDYGMGSQLIARGDGSSSQSLSETTRGQRDREQQALIDEAQWAARCLILDHRELLDALAVSLLANESITREEIDRIVAETPAAESTEPTESRESAVRANGNAEAAAGSGNEGERSESPSGVEPMIAPRFRRESETQAPIG
jgi:peptidase M41-like protein